MFKKLKKLLELIIALCGLTIFGVILTSVITRNIFGDSIAWAEEVCLLALAWLIMLGASLAACSGGSLRVTYFREKYLAKVKILDALLDIVVFAGSLWIIYLTIPQLTGGFSYKTPTVGIYRFFYILPVTISFTVFGIAQLREIVMKHFMKRDPYGNG